MPKFNKVSVNDADYKDVYQRVTDKIIADLETGKRTWTQPWKNGNAGGGISMPLRHDGTPYRGVNVLMLWIEAMSKGYTHAIWMTFKQAQALGAHVRKGEKGALVVYANSIVRKDETDPDAEDKVIPFMKGYGRSVRCRGRNGFRRGYRHGAGGSGAVWLGAVWLVATAAAAPSTDASGGREMIRSLRGGGLSLGAVLPSRWIGEGRASRSRR